LAALPQRTREVFLQHRLLDVPQADLAQRHHVSLATVEREITRAATALQAALDRWHGLPPASPPTRPHTSARRRGLGTLLGLAGVLGSSGLLWRVWQAQAPQWQMAWRTLRGQQARHRLPDGSHITLDAQTALNAAYYGNRRHVVLGSGAAFFDVAADAGRPFSVDCGVVRVTVLGTRFSVERSGDRVRVDVVHGRVRVEHSDPAQPTAPMRWELTVGDGLVIAPQSPGAAPSVEHVPAAGATWREGRLSFDRAPLSQILDRLARYHPRLLVVDPRVAQWPVTAEIRIAQADAWLRHVLPQAVDVKVVDTDQALRFEPRR
jgi:ferric-dicitrate binding protein FerR (iron transport regulator)